MRFVAQVAAFCLLLLVSGCGVSEQEHPLTKLAFSYQIVDGGKNVASEPSPDLDKFIDDEVESPGLSRLRFAQIMAKSLVKACPQYTVSKVTVERISIVPKGGEEQYLFIENLWASVRDRPGERKILMRHFLAFQIEMAARAIGTPTLQRKDIVPVIRSPEVAISSDKMLSENSQKDVKPSSIFSKQIAPGLTMLLMEDSPHSMRALTEEEILQLKITPAEIKLDSIKNLHTRLPKQIDFYGDGCYMLTAGGDYESSLILDDNLMKFAKTRVKGNLLFAIPNRNLFFVAGDGDPASVDMLRKQVALAESQPRPISSLLYTWDNGKISEFK